MTSQSPELRFGIKVDGQRSCTWRVRSAVQQPQIYIEREGLDRIMHVSLHSSDRWHIKVTGHGRAGKWGRPLEIVEGYTRAVSIVQPSSVAAITEPAPDGTVLIPMELDSSVQTQFDIYLERPGATMAGWPGKTAMDTTIVGRIPLAADAGTCCVVAHAVTVNSFKTAFTRPDDPDAIEQLRDRIQNGNTYATMISSQDDGTMALIDGRVELTEPAQQT